MIARVFVGVLLASLCSLAMAYPNPIGPTCLISLPKAEVVPVGSVDVAAAAQRVEFDLTATDALSGYIYPTRVISGVAPRWEVGVMGLPSSISGSVPGLPPMDFQLGTGWGVNAKYMLDTPTPIAVGASYAVMPLTVIAYLGEPTMQRGASRIALPPGAVAVNEEWKMAQLYAVATQNLIEGTDSNPTLTGTLGMNWTDVRFSNGVDGNALRPFAGLVLTFPNNVMLVGEYQPQNPALALDNTPVTSYGVRVPLGDNGLVETGFTNSYGTLGTPTQQFFAGVGFRFGAME